METIDLLALLRCIVLIICMAGAAQLDRWQRRVPNGYWVIWSQPLILLLALELLVRESDWTLWLTLAGILAWASTNVLGIPEASSLAKGEIEDWIVTIWYICGALGVLAGALIHAPTAFAMHGFGDPQTVLWCASCDTDAITGGAMMWIRLLGLAITIGFFEFSYRTRLLHGGADAKALMICAIALPWWEGLPVLFWSGGPESTSLVPPALSLLIWTAVGFLALPLITLIRNLKRGDASPLRLAWHAHRMDIDDVPSQHVWLLQEVIDGADGERKVETRMRPSRGSRAEKQVGEVLKDLRNMGIDRPWVTSKHPFLVYVLPAIPLAVLVGDPVSLVLGSLGF